MNKIDWQTGDALYEGHYLTTVKNHKGDIIVIPNYYSTCDGWVERDGEILAFYPCSEIEPYVEPKFKIGEMRDIFYENFKELIESCKELL